MSKELSKLIGDSMFKKINEKGQALIIVLFCSVVAALFVIAVLYMVTRGEQASGMQKRYETALDAADAGMSVSVKLINEQKLAISSSVTGVFAEASQLNIPTPTGCLQVKMLTPCTKDGCTSTWGAPCAVVNTTLDPRESPDIQFTIRGASGGSEFDV